MIMKPEFEVFLSQLIEQYPEEISALLLKYNIQKPASVQILRDAIIVYKDAFIRELYEIINSANLWGISLKGNPEKKALRQTKRNAKKAGTTEGEVAVSGWSKFVSGVKDGLGLTSQGVDVFNKAKGEPTGYNADGTPNYDTTTDNTMTYVIIGVVVVIVILGIFVMFKRKKS